MGFLSRHLSMLSFVIAFSAATFANTPREYTHFGHDISIGPGEEASEATCFGCTVRVRGHVAGDVTTFGGSIVVEDEGEIGGDTTTFGGDARLGKGVKVGGDVTVFGGRIRRDPTSSVHGDVTNFGGGVWILLIFGLPLVVLGAFIALIVWLIRRLLRPAIPAPA